MSDPLELSASELVEHYRVRSLSPKEVIAASLQRLADGNSLRPTTAFAADRALEEASRAETLYRRPRAQLPPLLGVPFVAKDLFDSAEVQTAYGSALFSGHRPPRDAALLELTRAAGAVMVAKSTTHEFGWGITTGSPAFGPTCNPWHPGRIPGGSSGGSAVAVAIRAVPLALGTDTGGSVRLPAAYCGVVGFKPSYGVLPLCGAMPLAPSLDHAGLMARDPGDLAAWMAAIGQSALADGSDLTADGLAGARVGVTSGLESASLAPGVEAALARVTGVLESLGAEPQPATLPAAEAMFGLFTPIQQAEALQVHRGQGLFPNRASEYSPDVRRHLTRAQEVSMAEYTAAIATRERLRSEVQALFDQLDLILSPVSACRPPLLGQQSVPHRGRTVAFRDLVMPYTVPHNLFGLPSCAVFAGLDDDGLPVGLQLAGGPRRDAFVLAAARAIAAELKPPAPPRQNTAETGADL